MSAVVHVAVAPVVATSTEALLHNPPGGPVLLDVVTAVERQGRGATVVAYSLSR